MVIGVNLFHTWLTRATEYATPKQVPGLTAAVRDPRIAQYERAAETIAEKLAHVTFQTGQPVIMDYYASHPERNGADGHLSAESAP